MLAIKQKTIGDPAFFSHFPTSCSPQLACTVMAGLLHFLVVAGFVWMLLEALQLHLLVRRLSKVQVIQRDGLPRPLLYLIGYGAPFTVVGVSALVYSDGYGATEAKAWVGGGVQGPFLQRTNPCSSWCLHMSFLFVCHVRDGAYWFFVGAGSRWSGISTGPCRGPWLLFWQWVHRALETAPHFKAKMWSIIVLQRPTPPLQLPQPSFSFFFSLFPRLSVIDLSPGGL